VLKDLGCEHQIDWFFERQRAGRVEIPYLEVDAPHAQRPSIVLSKGDGGRSTVKRRNPYALCRNEAGDRARTAAYVQKVFDMGQSGDKSGQDIRPGKSALLDEADRQVLPAISSFK